MLINKEQVYLESNKIEKVAIASVAKKEYENVLGACENIHDRQIRAQEFCDYLCKKLNISRLLVRVVNKPQPHSDNAEGNLRSKTLGTYTVGREVITMYNLTAKQQKVVAIKTFVNTLLHEFIHHYDVHYMKLPTSYHTKGFYARLKDLKDKCEK